VTGTSNNRDKHTESNRSMRGAWDALLWIHPRAVHRTIFSRLQRIDTRYRVKVLYDT